MRRKIFADHPPTPSQREAIRIALETPAVPLLPPSQTDSLLTPDATVAITKIDKVKYVKGSTKVKVEGNYVVRHNDPIQTNGASANAPSSLPPVAHSSSFCSLTTILTSSSFLPMISSALSRPAAASRFSVRV